MLMNYHIGRLVLSSLCVGDLVRLVLSGAHVAVFKPKVSKCINQMNVVFDRTLLLTVDTCRTLRDGER